MELQEFLQEYKSIIIIIHAIGAAIGVGSATISDVTFFDFLKDGRVDAKESSVFQIFTKTIWLALGILILSGIALFLSNPEFYAQSPKFILKMGIVGILTLNGMLMTGYLHRNMEKLNFQTPGNIRLKRTAMISGAISISSWYVAFILGSLRSLPIRFYEGLIIYGLVLFIGVGVSQILYKRYSETYKK